MNNNNHQNSNCSFSAEIAGYIYNEIGAKEKSVFEAHLPQCDYCPEELADFMDIRFSVAEWRENEFAHLPTPLIKIPYENTQVVETETISGSWSAALRRIFTVSPVLTTSAALAALIICLGLIFAVGKYSAAPEIAEVESRSEVKATVSPTAEIPVKNSGINDVNKDSSEKTAAPLKNAPTNPQTEITRETLNNKDDNKTSVIKATEKVQKNKIISPNSENVSPNKSLNQTNKKPNLPTRNQTKPKLNNFDEDEDDSLRLAELFEDVETK